MLIKPAYQVTTYYVSGMFSSTWVAYYVDEAFQIATPFKLNLGHYIYGDTLLSSNMGVSIHCYWTGLPLTSKFNQCSRL